MKKIIFFSVMLLLLVAPAWGAVVIKLEQVGDTNEFKVMYDVNGEPNRFRAFGLDITVDNGGKVSDANWLKWGTPKYQIYPGSIDINAAGIVQDYGSPVGDPCGLPDGTTLPGLDTNGVSIEMGSLYVGTPNAPPSSGTLLSIFINSANDCNIILAGNAARTGTGSASPGFVMEDPDQKPAVLFKHKKYHPVTTAAISGTVTCDGAGLAGVTISGLPGAPVTDGSGNYSDDVTVGWSGTAIPAKAGYTFEPNKIVYNNVTTDQTGQNYAADCLYVGRTFSTGTGTFTVNATHMTRWVGQGKPSCWCCASQKRGNGVYTPASTAGKVDTVDLAKVKNAAVWTKSCGQSGYYVCSDVDLSCKIDTVDLARIKNAANWTQTIGTCPTPGLRGTCP